jgi:hypothetical protein
MNTSLIRKIIASDLPRKEQDLLILLVTDYDSVNQKKVAALDSYYRENEPEYSEGDCESNSDNDSETTDKSEPEDGSDCDDPGYNKAIRAEYEARHGRIMSGSELAANASAEKSISRDDSTAWGLQFPSHTIWGNWVHSYDK